MSSSTARLPGESENAYIIRLGDLKSSGVIDMTWTELAEILNKELREDPTEYYSESAYRKRYNLFAQFKEEFGNPTESADAAELRELRRELEKERVKVRDERNEYRRLLREEARKESYKDQFVRSICEAAQVYPLDYKEKPAEISPEGDNDLLISLFDLHTGIKIDSFFNKFDEDVLRERLRHYLDRIIEIQRRHHSRDAFIICSELLSGIIRPTIRLENNQDVIDQFLLATRLVADFVAELSSHFETVNVYVAPGNHSRVTANKEESLTHENLDNLVIPFLRAELREYENVRCWDNEIKSDTVMFPVRNYNVFSVHGDKDTLDNVADNMIHMYGIKPHIIMTGHRHTNALKTVYDVKCIQAGCLNGSDSYCEDKRLRNRPEQVVCVISEAEGLDCIYDVKF